MPVRWFMKTFPFITLPITVKLQDIENQTNLLLNGLIYQDNNIDDDDIEIRCGNWPHLHHTHNEKSGIELKSRYR
jgi:hypothetical protein